MLWHLLTENPEVMAELYDEIPLLEPIDLMKVVLSTEDAKMSLAANLSRVPDKLPPERVKQGHNTAYIQLEFRDLQSLRVARWSTENLVDARIEQTVEGQISLNIISPRCDIRAIARSLKITSISTYRQGTF
jgi:hypothetical protein